MSQPYDTFIFASYDFDPDTKTATFTYQLDDELSCTESYVFDFPYVAHNSAALDSALQLLFFLAGVSYYKMYLPPTIEVRAGSIDTQLSAFLSETYQKGLGEFFYTNSLDPNTHIEFPVTGKKPAQNIVNSAGSLVAIGGGKDSLVSIELLRKTGEDMATWSVGHHSQLAPLIKRVGLPHYFVGRTLDPKIPGLRAAGALNGHVPISAIFAAVGTVVAVLTGKQDIVLSNEQSANEPTLVYKDTPINHQYSKSQEFESSYQQIISSRFGETIRYYSLLRPFTELRIAEMFAETGFQKYKDVFSSCNRAFRQGESRMSWCGECPKCAFVFLALTPFTDKLDLTKIFNGKNLLLDDDLTPTYHQLLGIEGDKPMECIGSVAESRAAMHLAQALYPELSKYTFELPANYDFRATYPSLAPLDIQNITK